MDINLSGLPDKKEIDLSGLPDKVDLAGLPDKMDFAGLPDKLSVQDHIQSAIPEIINQLRASLLPPGKAEFTPEQMARPLQSSVAQQEMVLPPIDGEPARPMGASYEQVSKVIHNPEDPLGTKGLEQLGAAAYQKGMGQPVSPEQEQALQDFAVENFKGLVLYPAAITVTANAVGWYLANKTLPGAINSARTTIRRGLVAKGVPEAEATRMADEGLSQAVSKAQAGGAEPGIPEFVGVRKAAEKGDTN